VEISGFRPEDFCRAAVLERKTPLAQQGTSLLDVTLSRIGAISPIFVDLPPALCCHALIGFFVVLPVGGHG